MKQYENLFNILKIYRSNNIGPVNFFYLINKFKNVTNIINNIDSLSTKWNKEIKLIDDWVIEEEIEKTTKYGANFITYTCEEYPFGKQILFTPVLTILGNKDLLTKAKISIVGTRLPSLNGILFCKNLVKELAYNNFVIVSGLAKGIDIEAHKASIKTGTIAVMPGGIDQIYPLEHKIYYEEIKQNGLIVAENPIGTILNTGLFPKRNSIIAGLGISTIVIESMIKSGALITAEQAHKYGKKVFAVPGHPFDNRYEGNNELLKKYGLICTNVNDILKYTKNMKEENEELIDFPDFTEKEQQEILSLIGSSPVNISSLASFSNLEINKILSILIEMEIMQLVKIQPDNTVFRLSI